MRRPETYEVTASELAPTVIAENPSGLLRSFDPFGPEARVIRGGSFGRGDDSYRSGHRPSVRPVSSPDIFWTTPDIVTAKSHHNRTSTTRPCPELKGI